MLMNARKVSVVIKERFTQLTQRIHQRVVHNIGICGGAEQLQKRLKEWGHQALFKVTGT